MEEVVKLDSLLKMWDLSLGVSHVDEMTYKHTPKTLKNTIVTNLGV